MLIATRGIVVVLFVLAFGAIAVEAQQPAINMITAEELKAKMARNEPVVVVDVRSPEGFASSTTTVVTNPVGRAPWPS